MADAMFFSSGQSSRFTGGPELLNQKCGPCSVAVSVQDCYEGDPGLIPGPVSEGWKH